MAVDIFEEIRIIINLLKKEGFDELSKELHDYMAGACTGGELFAGTSFGIANALKADLSDTTRARAISVKKKLDPELPFGAFLK